MPTKTTFASKAEERRYNSQMKLKDEREARHDPHTHLRELCAHVEQFIDYVEDRYLSDSSLYDLDMLKDKIKMVRKTVRGTAAVYNVYTPKKGA